MCICWATIAIGITNVDVWFNPSTSLLMKGAELGNRHHLLEETLLHHFGKTAEILIFLMGDLLQLAIDILHTLM